MSWSPFLFLLALTGRIFTLDLEPENYQIVRLDDQLTRVTECIRHHLTNGYEEIGLPPLDPLELDELYFNLSNFTYTGGEVTINDLVLEGIPNFQMTDASLSVIPVRATLEFTVNIEGIVANFEYDGNVDVFDLIFAFGAGHANLQLRNLRVPLQAIIGLNSVEEGHVGLYLDSTKVRISGVLNDEEISVSVSAQLVHMVDQLFREHQEDINNYVTNTVMGFLGHNTVEDLLNFLDDVEDSCANIL